MSLYRFVLPSSLILSVGAQAAVAVYASSKGGFEDNVWLAGLFAFSLGILSALGLRRGHFWVGAIFLCWTVGFVVVGIGYGFAAIGLLVSLCASLVFWDLVRWKQRVGSLATPQQAALLERRHLASLFKTIGAGFVLALAAILVQIKLNFALELLLALALLVGLGQLVKSLRSPS